jgi:hypothetical protein
MAKTSPQQNKALVLEAFATLSMQPPNGSRPIAT